MIPKDGYVFTHIDNVKVPPTSDKVVDKKELVAMFASSMLEINKGDTNKKSLNVKLYKALKEYSIKEIEASLE